MRPAASLVRFTGAVAVAIALTAACRKSVGEKCRGFEAHCADKAHALACHDGKLVDVACAGPLGCSTTNDKVSCDDSIANLGEPCMAGADEEYACSADKKRALYCATSKKFELYLECRGPNGCAGLGARVSCDTSLAAKDDPCKTEGAAACSDDGKEMLACTHGKFTTYRYCRGSFGCRQNGDTPQCDESLSLENDPCGIPGRVVCSVDGTAELQCEGSRYVLSRRCRKTGCVVTNRPGRLTDCD